MTMSNPPIHDKLTYLCYYLSIKHPHILVDALQTPPGMLAENRDARREAGVAAEILSESYERAHAPSLA